MTAITFTANAATYDVAAVADAATENAPQSKGLLVRILRSPQQSLMHEKRRVIVRYAHLLPEGHAADVLRFIAADQAHLD